jgi:hypothetical protein
MAIATGQRTTTNELAAQRYIDIKSEILLLEPESQPLTVITNKIGQQGQSYAAKDPKFSWIEDHLFSRFDAADAAGYTSAVTTINVVTGTVFFVSALVAVPRTGEIMFVSSIATNALTVIRGYSGSTAAALVANEPLLVLGSAVEEGVASLTPRWENPTKIDNYTQIIKHSIEESNTARSSSNTTSPHDWVHQHKKTMIEHQKEKEYMALFGQPIETTGPAGKPLRTSGGALYFLSANRQAMGGTMTEPNLETWLRSMRRYGGRNRLALAGGLPLSVVNAFSIGRMKTTVGDTKYGVDITQWISGSGTLTFVYHPLLEGAIYGGYIIALDMSADIGYRYLNGEGPGPSRDTKVYPNRQAPDLDAQRDELITECGFQFPQKERHGVATGITG